MRPYDSRLFNFTSEPFKYFQKYIHFLRRMNITTGLCVPNECSREELTFIVGALYDRFNTGLTADVDLCYSSPISIPWRPSEVIGLSIILLIIFLNFVGTRCPDDSLLASFNWSENCKKLFSIKPSADESMNFLDGIKVLTMFLVVLSHFQMGNMYNLYTNAFEFIQVAINPIFILVYLAPYTVDLFIMVTGLLMGYYFFSGKRRLNLITYIIGRWIRFATILGWIICLQFILYGEHFRHKFGGPLWGDYNGVGSIVQSCEKTWLPTLLLNQFWFDSSKDVNVCLLFDWYLAADFTLAILFLFVLIPYLKNHPKLSIINTIILIFVGLALSGLGIHFLGIPTTWITTNYQRKAFLQYSFDFNLKPWPHISPYFVGVLFGYFLSRPKLKLSQLTLGFGWLVCLFCLSLNFTYEYVVNRFGIDPEYKIALAYGTVSKTIWAIGWAWIILILKLGYASSVSNFLSRPTFRILSRINLSVLCTNLLIIRLRSATARTLTYPSYSDVFWFHYIPMYFIIYSIAMLSTLLIEFPTVNLLKKLFSSPQQHEIEGNNNCNKKQVVVDKQAKVTNC
ncbi:uncharacterized protein LOC107362744 [Tetranychus urticae]|nr:uncharacterized protein LOC107362744 [Tetranychus urticae]